jgi:hypothetical protein
MDPNANLREQDALTRSRTDLARLRDLRQALAGWLAAGGVAPDWGSYLYATDAYRRWAKRYDATR